LINCSLNRGDYFVGVYSGLSPLFKEIRPSLSMRGQSYVHVNIVDCKKNKF
jgi:hypothetical protein